MTPKQYLSRYRTLNAHIDSLCRERDHLRELAEHVTATDYTHEHVDGGSRATGEVLIYKLIDSEERINSEIDTLCDLRDEITAAINAVDNDTERLLLRLRYVDCMKWEQIASELCLCERVVYRLHGRALQKVRESQYPTVL